MLGRIQFQQVTIRVAVFDDESGRYAVALSADDSPGVVRVGRCGIPRAALKLGDRHSPQPMAVGVPGAIRNLAQRVYVERGPRAAFCGFAFPAGRQVSVFQEVVDVVYFPNRHLMHGPRHGFFPQRIVGVELPDSVVPGRRQGRHSRQCEGEHTQNPAHDQNKLCTRNHI